MLYDLKKALDCVSHHVYALNYGIMYSDRINFIRSYLTGRTQITNFNELLARVSVEQGFPQGSRIELLPYIFFYK